MAFIDKNRETLLNHNRLGRELRRIRKAKHIRPFDLDKIGVIGKNHLWKIEAGVILPTLDTLFLLCEHLGVPVSEVIKAIE